MPTLAVLHLQRLHVRLQLLHLVPQELVVLQCLLQVVRHALVLLLHVCSLKKAQAGNSAQHYHTLASAAA